MYLPLKQDECHRQKAQWQRRARTRRGGAKENTQIIERAAVRSGSLARMHSFIQSEITQGGKRRPHGTCELFE